MNGGTSGLVSLEDIYQKRIVGDISDEFDDDKT
jgi:Mg2+/Co2+ transporter CorC